MTQSPEISIIIPCYNAERYLRETVESALAQSVQQTEVILVDDGSTDGTREILRSYEDRVRSEFLTHAGVSAARTHGARISRGRFLQFLDSDDLLLPGALESRRDALERSGADVAYSGWQKWVERHDGTFGPGEIFDRAMEEVHADPEIAVFTDFWSPPVALLYRREIVERIGSWHVGLPVIQDARFLQDAAFLGGRFVRLPGVSGYYRVSRVLSLSRRVSLALVRDCLINGREIEARWRDGGRLDAARLEALLQVYFQIARSSRCKDESLFREAWGEVRRLRPGFCPQSPRHLAVLSRWLGYPAAESVVLWARALKNAASRRPLDG